ncbi:DUF2809 domain-containing protein [Nonomuraea angiospora]|uniref:DUF2809 domain-containing protein n=1 Tax=Nonomuraea angiospora TaxID=46172 RepID=UPI00342BF075
MSKYAGDALHTVLIYMLVALILPQAKPWVAVAVAVALTLTTGASWTIESAQLREIPSTLQPPPGSTLNPPDLFWYSAGSATARAASGGSGQGRARPAHTLWLRRTG